MDLVNYVASSNQRKATDDRHVGAGRTDDRNGMNNQED